jgi:murein DD-endopeptidase MepM/ murein hydrolase activator NlpD
VVLRRGAAVPLLVLVAAAVGAGVPAALGGDSLTSRQAAITAEIGELRATIEEAKRREQVLTTDLRAADRQIAVVEETLGAEQTRLASLERELAASEARLADLRASAEEQARLLAAQEREQGIAQRRLEQRLVELYKTQPADPVTAVLLGLDELGDVLNELDYLDKIAAEDREIVAEVRAAREATAVLRRRTIRLRTDVARETALLLGRTEAQRVARDAVSARRSELVRARDDERILLERVRSSRVQASEDLEEQERASRELARRIAALRTGGRVAATTGSGANPTGGLVWPVDGPLTSGFGPRWGRMHEGIDIGVGFGTPIGAAYAGTVVYAGWLGGYGNLVVVDHGNGLSTAYGHQQRIHVSVGDAVAQGDVLGEVGSTGNSTGPHLHFEVRVNGAAVDPLGYL